MICCENCGAALKHPVEYRGRIYGTECVNIVSGRRFEEWVVRREAGRDVVDVCATAERDAAREARIAETRERQRMAAEQAAQRGVAQAWIADALDGRGDFLSSLARELRGGCAFSAYSDKMQRIIADEYARAFGRRASRKYDNAREEFWSRVGVSR